MSWNEQARSRRGPLLRSPAAGFRQALLDAHAVAYIDPAAGGSSGIYLSQLFERMGIANEVGRKAVLVRGGLAAQRLTEGSADLALQQMSELLAVPGIKVLGPIPDELQNYTVYAGAIGARVRDPAAAKALLAALTGPSAKSVLLDKGMQPP